MVCKICGCEMINNGSWLACPTCGAVEFGVEEETAASTPSTSSTENAEDEIELLEKDLNEFFNSFSPEAELKKEEAPEPESNTASAVEETPQEPEIKTAPVVEEKEEEPEIETAPVIEEEPENDVISAFEEKAEEAGNDIISAFEDKNEAPESDITSVFDEKEDSEAEEGVFFTKDFTVSSIKSYSFTDDFTPETAEADAFEDYEDTFTDDEPSHSNKKSRSKKDKKKNDKDKKKSPLRDIVEFLIPIVAAVIIAFFLKTFIIANAVVPTGSMMETINVKDRIIASRLAYRTEDPQRYDIVLFYYPENEKEIFVKRVLGLPGETLTVIDGVVYVTTKDGKTIQTDQSFVNPNDAPTGNYGPYYIPEKGEEITVENGYCYAENGMSMGSTDFLDKYCTKNSNGNYVIANDLYFMMGDNRNSSQDSRKWIFPFVADDKIIGKVIFKYYPRFEKLG